MVSICLSMGNMCTITKTNFDTINYHIELREPLILKIVYLQDTKFQIRMHVLYKQWELLMWTFKNHAYTQLRSPSSPYDKIGSEHFWLVPRTLYCTAFHCTY